MGLGAGNDALRPVVAASQEGVLAAVPLGRREQVLSQPGAKRPSFAAQASQKPRELN